MGIFEVNGKQFLGFIKGNVIEIFTYGKRIKIDINNAKTIEII
jgi:hypothetical protein